MRRPASATLALLRPNVNGMAGVTRKSGERPHLCERVAKSKGRPGYGECRFPMGPETTSAKVIYQEPQRATGINGIMPGDLAFYFLAQTGNHFFNGLWKGAEETYFDRET